MAKRPRGGESAIGRLLSVFPAMKINLSARGMILCIGATPAAQRVMVFRKFLLDEVNRAATTLDGAAGKAVNVAKVLKILGEQPLATGFLGGDRGRAIGALLQNREI